MQIKGTDAPDSARIGATRATVGQLTPQKDAGQAEVSLALSRTGRVVAEALARVLPEAGGLRVGQILTPADHAMLALASELVDASGLPAEQLRNLVNDLAAYRLMMRTAARAEGPPRREGAAGGALARPTARQTSSHPLAPRKGPEPAEGGARGGFLTLRAFGVRDEALARDILRSPAVRGGVIDRGFVTALLDPDVGPAPSVDLGFLRQLAGALTLQPAVVAKAQPQAEVSSMIARRDARGFLARALSALALPTEGIAEVTPDRTVHGDTLLRARMPSLLDRLGVWLSTRTPSTATQTGPNATVRGEVTPAWVPAAGEPVPAPKPRDARASQPGAAARAAHTPTPPNSPVRDERVPLTRDDRALLRLLYSAAAERGTDLRGVDEVAAALVAFRRAELADAGRAGRAQEPVPDPRHAPANDVAPRASLSQRPASSGTYTARPSMPPAPPSMPRDPQRPAALAAPDAALLADDKLSQSRSYGSTTQMAARLANSYGRLAPVGMEPPPAAAADYVAREAATRAVALLREPDVTLPYAGTLPLDLGHALGLGALFSEVQRVTARTRRQRRRKKRQQLMRAIGALGHTMPTPGSESGARDRAPSRGGSRSRLRAKKR